MARGRCVPGPSSSTGRHPIAAVARSHEGLVRRTSAWLHRHVWVRLGLVLGGPLLWMVVVYLGALGFLFVNAFWKVDPFSGLIQRQWGFTNFQTLWQESVYRIIVFRTAGIAAAVTVADVMLGLPLAYYVVRIARPRVRNALLLSIVLPLWASYLVRVFAWQIILTPNGILNWSVVKLHLGHLQIGSSNWAIWLTFTYLWLPFMTLPTAAALERLPASYLEASSDLGGRGWMTFRRIVWPLTLPGIVAGSIFTFSLTLGDYIAPQLVGNTKFIGNVVYESVGVANNVPFAAAFALVPVAIMAFYLLIAKRLGAFEAL